MLLIAGLVLGMVSALSFLVGVQVGDDRGPRLVSGGAVPPLPTAESPATTEAQPTSTAAPTTTAAPNSTGATPFVPPEGFDALPAPTFDVFVDALAPEGGNGTEGAPFRTISQALAIAEPGDDVRVGPGTYQELVRSVRDGTEDAPIRLIGVDAELRGAGDDRLIQIDHDYITVESFDLAGADNLIWVQEATGVRVLGNTLSDAKGECIRMKYFAVRNEVARNDISGCGQEGFDLEEDSKNGEGVYIGTAPEQLDKNPTEDVDVSEGNWVHDNVFQVPGECVDLKEGTTGNVVTSNTCTGGEDPEGGGFSSRGDGNVFRDNISTGHAGAGIRLGGDEDDQGLHNDVIGNVLTGNEGYGLKVLREPQGVICGNEASDNGEGNARDDAADDPTQPC